MCSSLPQVHEIGFCKSDQSFDHVIKGSFFAKEKISIQLLGLELVGNIPFGGFRGCADIEKKIVML